MDLTSIFNMLINENNPPLHFVLLHVWVKFFGISSFSVRFISVCFAALTASLIFLTGNRYFNRTTGLTAGLFYTFSTMHMFFSHEARVYSIFVCLTILSLYFFLGFINNPNQKKNIISLSVANILLIYSHYFGFFIIVCQVISLFFISQYKIGLKKYLWIILILIFFYLPNILIFYQRLSVSVSQGTWVKPPDITELYGNINRFLNDKYVSIILIIVLIISNIIAFKHKRWVNTLTDLLNHREFRIVLIWFIFPYLVMFLVSFKVPMFIDRYILFTSISLYLCLAFIIDKITFHKSIKALAFIAIFALMLLTFSLKPDNNRNVSKVTDFIKKEKIKDKECLVFISPEYSFLEFTYHYNINYFKDYRNSISLLNDDNIFPLRTLTSFDTNRLKRTCNVILIDCGTEFAFGKNQILAELNASCKTDSSFTLNQTYQIYRFNCCK